MMFARWTLLAAVHRMSASSRKSVSMLRVTSRHGLSSDVKPPSPAAGRRSDSVLVVVEAEVLAIRSW